MPKGKITEVMILNGGFKQIAVTCRCGVRFTDEVPEFLDHVSEVQVILHCPSCKQMYGTAMGKVARLNDWGLPEKILGATETQSTTTQKPVQAKEPDDDKWAEGKIIQPESKLVN